jgi:hypothetical protein
VRHRLRESGPSPPNSNHKHAAPASNGFGLRRAARAVGGAEEARALPARAAPLPPGVHHAPSLPPLPSVRAPLPQFRPPGLDLWRVRSHGARSRAAFRPDRSLAAHVLPICFPSPVNDWRAVAFMGDTGSGSRCTSPPYCGLCPVLP